MNSAALSRRDFLAAVSALGASGLLGLPLPAAAEPPPEVRRIRLIGSPAICLAPQYVAQELLHLEGFTEVAYVSAEIGGEALASARACTKDPEWAARHMADKG